MEENKNFTICTCCRRVLLHHSLLIVGRAITRQDYGPGYIHCDSLRIFPFFIISHSQRYVNLYMRTECNFRILLCSEDSANVHSLLTSSNPSRFRLIRKHFFSRYISFGQPTKSAVGRIPSSIILMVFSNTDFIAPRSEVTVRRKRYSPPSSTLKGSGAVSS